MTDGNTINIKDGRHPVIEQMPDAERFVPNDSLLDCESNRLLIITGPNMVPVNPYTANSVDYGNGPGRLCPGVIAELSVVDRIFTRVGAGDDLAGGRSTFMVEMQETANILTTRPPPA